MKAMDHGTGRTVAWVTGGREAATFQRLYNEVKHVTSCIVYTDDWEAFAQVLPPDRHVIGKAHTVAMERDRSDTRHHLGRMTRRSQVVLQKEFMVKASIKLWLALTRPDIFIRYQALYLCTFI